MPIAIILKYFSIKSFMVSPNFHSKKAKRKNRAPLPITDARVNIVRSIWNAPPDTVNNL